MGLLQKVNSGMGSPDWHVSMFDIHFRKILWVYCPGHAGAKGNDRADRLAGKAAIKVGLHLGSSEALRNLRHYMRTQSQGHHTIDRPEERGVRRKRKRSTVSPERTKKSPIVKSIRPTLELFQGQQWGHALMRDWIERILWAFSSAQVPSWN